MEPKPTFASELAHLLNHYSQESGSNTPDFILAWYLQGCLALWNECVTDRERWYGRTGNPATVAQQDRLNMKPLAPPMDTKIHD
jgi:hypothetical protein